MSSLSPGGHNGESNVHYPVIVFDRDLMMVVDAEEELSRTNARALRRGYLANGLLVDQDGVVRRVQAVRKLKRLRGILNPIHRIELSLETVPHEGQFERLKARTLEALEGTGWSSMVGVEFLRDRVEAASSARDIVQALKSSTV